MQNQILDFLQKQISPELQQKLAQNLNIDLNAIDKGITNLSQTLLNQLQSNQQLKDLLAKLDKDGDGNISNDIQRMINETGTNVPESMKNLGAQIASHLTPDELNKLAASMGIDKDKVVEAIHNLGPVILQQMQSLRANPATSNLMAFVDKNVDQNALNNVVNKLDGFGKSLFGKPDATKDSGKDI